MKKLIWILFSLLFIFSASSPISLSAERHKHITGKANVTDGDTIRIGKIRIRLFGIDAPETNQLCSKKNDTYKCGSISTKILKEYVRRKTVNCYYVEKDRYGRILGTCFLAYDDSKLSLNRYMVNTGYAVAYKKYSKKYLDSEKLAKDNHLGMWQGNFERPEKWRRKNK